MHGLVRVVVSLAVALAVGGRAVAADLLVEWGNPNAYQTLQAALDAAQPGDRILIKGGTWFSTPLHVTKSVTIESFDSTRQTISLGFIDSPRYQWGQVLVDSLTTGIPLVLRRLSFVPMFGGGYVFEPMIKTSGQVVGEVRLEDVDLTFPPLDYGQLLVDLEVEMLWLRGCRLEAADDSWLCGCGICYLEADGKGSSCLRFTGRRLVLDSCTLRAGSGAYIYLGSCEPQYHKPLGQDGGFALIADSAETLLVRTSLSDGNGGSVEDAAWSVTPRPGRATASRLVGAGGVVNAFDVQLEQGVDGVVGGYDPGRGATTSIGDPLAPLSVGGSGVLGERVTVDVAPFQHSAAGLLIGHGWGLVPTPFGNALLDFTLPVVAVAVSQPSISFHVPNDAALVHLPVVSQLFYANEGWFFGNASGLEIRR